MIDLDWIRRLIDLVDESEIDSLEISRFGTRVRVSKSPPIYVGSAASASPAPAGVPGAPAVADMSEQPAGSSSPEAEPVDDMLVEVASPMVGTFYGAPAPDAPSYVEVGDRVRTGQTLCILEAMKLMNELEAEVSGTIREICVGNGDPVEYGQTLFRIEPD